MIVVSSAMITSMQKTLGGITPRFPHHWRLANPAEHHGEEAGRQDGDRQLHQDDDKLFLDVRLQRVDGLIMNTSTSIGEVS